MLQRAKQNEGASLSHEFVQGLLGTLESEWSRVAVRGLLSSFLSGNLLSKMQSCHIYPSQISPSYQ